MAYVLDFPVHPHPGPDWELLDWWYELPHRLLSPEGLQGDPRGGEVEEVVATQVLGLGRGTPPSAFYGPGPSDPPPVVPQPPMQEPPPTEPQPAVHAPVEDEDDVPLVRRARRVPRRRGCRVGGYI
ncbi:hypothetical protein PIB30_068724 [Stylosanthes scabra]|uniref:Uncharacterized protein n=1 Tax=Stylosanthes scabra TaxID=79078 RepID=A0ABU6YPD2_9FABA|nr:hypothetical protein [Stylosanthes scabra]